MPIMAAGIAAGGSILGGIFGSKGQQSQSTSAPWSGQQPYLRTGFQDAQNALNPALAMGAYSGQRVAGLNPYQQQGYDGTASFANNQGMGAANSLLGAAQGTLGFGQQFGQNAQDLYNKAGQDPTQQIIGNAGAYANNPYLNGQIDAASRDISRNLNEQQLPGLDNSASATGNMNSSRTGVAQGIMERGAADRIGDISSQMRGAAYNNGLGMAQSQYNTGMNQQGAANGQMLSAGDFGRIATDSGLNAGYSANDALTKAGAGFQTQDQNQLNGQMSAYTDQQNNGLNLVGKYMNAINGNFGQQTTSQVGGGTGGMMQGALAGGLGGLGLFGQYKGQGVGQMMNNSMSNLNPNSAMNQYYGTTGTDPFGYTTSSTGAYTG